jgi:hypothetical protein
MANCWTTRARAANDLARRAPPRARHRFCKGSDPFKQERESMKARMQSLLAAAIVSLTATAGWADTETSVRKSSTARPAAGAKAARAGLPTTTDEWRAFLIRQQNTLEARSAGQIVHRVPMRATTTDEARSEAIDRQADIAARGEGQPQRRMVPKRYPTTTDEARGL